MKKMKKIVAFLFAVIMTVTVCIGAGGPLTVRAVENVSNMKFTDTRGIVWKYDIVDDVVIITDCWPDSVNSFDGVVYIPKAGDFPAIGELPVVVNEGAVNIEDMKELHIPDGVKLSKGAIYNCGELTKVVPESRLSDDWKAFDGCDKVNLKIPTYQGAEGWLDYRRTPLDPAPFQVKDEYELTDEITENGITRKLYKAKALYMLDSNYTVKYMYDEGQFLTNTHLAYIWDFTGSSAWTGANYHNNIWYPEFERDGKLYPGTLKTIRFEEGIKVISPYIVLDQAENCKYDVIDIYIPESCTELNLTGSFVGGRPGKVRIHGVAGSVAEEFVKRNKEEEKQSQHVVAAFFDFEFVAEKPGESGTSGDSADKGWREENGESYWYENGEKQGTTGRGKEIFDPKTNAWYWLDAVSGGTIAKNKEVYMDSGAGVYADNPDGTGKWVRYDADGRMVKGWYTNENGTYYYDTWSGAMAKGTIVLEKAGKKTAYEFDTETGIKTGEFEVADDFKMFGWNEIGGVPYWFEEGVKQGVFGRGKETYDPDTDAWYWLDSVDGGKKAVSKDVYQESGAGPWGEKEGADGERYGKWVRYDKDGYMIKGWSAGTGADAVKINSPDEANGRPVYYFDTTYGTMAKGRVVIDGKSYYFDEENGVLKE